MLRYGSELPIKTQVQAIPAMCALHNFIRIHDPTDNIEPLEEEDQRRSSQVSAEAFPRSGGVSRAEVVRANKRWDAIAKVMWEGYLTHRW